MSNRVSDHLFTHGTIETFTEIHSEFAVSDYAPFEEVKDMLREAFPELATLRLRSVTPPELTQMARENPPPAEWYEGEEECPF